MEHERLLASRWVYSSKGNPNGELTRQKDEFFEGYHAKVKVGDTHRVWAAAPGAGHWDYVITRITDDEVYGRQVDDTTYIQAPEDVR